MPPLPAVLTAADTIFGAGGRKNSLRKDSMYRQLIVNLYVKYESLSNTDKAPFVNERIIDVIRSQGGRFFYQPDKKTYPDDWARLCPENPEELKIIETKVAQAIRDAKKLNKHNTIKSKKAIDKNRTNDDDDDDDDESKSSDGDFKKAEVPKTAGGQPQAVCSASIPDKKEDIASTTTTTKATTKNSKNNDKKSPNKVPIKVPRRTQLKSKAKAEAVSIRKEDIAAAPILKLAKIDHGEPKMACLQQAMHRNLLNSLILKGKQTEASRQQFTANVVSDYDCDEDEDPIFPELDLLKGNDLPLVDDYDFQLDHVDLQQLGVLSLERSNSLFSLGFATPELEQSISGMSFLGGGARRVSVMSQDMAEFDAIECNLEDDDTPLGLDAQVDWSGFENPIGIFAEASY